MGFEALDKGVHRQRCKGARKGGGKMGVSAGEMCSGPHSLHTEPGTNCVPNFLKFKSCKDFHPSVMTKHWCV